LSMMISGPRQPGNDIDVYLSPLIEDLRLLWDEGVEVFDAYESSISICKHCYYGLLMIFQHMEILVVIVSKDIMLA